LQNKNHTRLWLPEQTEYQYTVTPAAGQNLKRTRRSLNVMAQGDQTGDIFRYLFKLRNEKVGFFDTGISKTSLVIGARIWLRTSEAPLAVWWHADGRRLLT
jgi:hypothetical protein